MKLCTKKHIKAGLEMYIKKGIYIKVIAFALFAMLAISCSSQKATSTASKQASTSNKLSALTLVLRDNYGGSISPEIQVIKEPSALKDFFKGVNRTRKPGLAMPKINFEEEMVVIVCTGEQQNNQMPALYAIDEMEDKMILSVQEEAKENGSSSSAYTTPFCMYKMPLTSKELVFQKN